MATLTIADANRHIDELVRTFQKFLKKDTRLTPTEIIKGGSLGHGTAVPGDFDLDLVLYSEDISPEVVVDIGVDNILNRLDIFLRKRLGDAYEYVKTTPFALQFKLHGEIDIDLLPSPYWGNEPDRFHQFLKDKEESVRRKFFSSASKWQVEFFKKQPNEVKEYIKRFKVWRNHEWSKGNEDQGRPKSYLLGLLMVRAYENSQDKSLASIERELKSMIRNHETMYIDWNKTDKDIDNLTRDEYNGFVRSGRFTEKPASADSATVVYDNVDRKERRYYPALPQLFPSNPLQHRMTPPAIVDVGNPYNNIYKTGIGRYRAKGSAFPGGGNWTKFTELIGSFSLKDSV